MSILPARFLFHVAYACPEITDMPNLDSEELLELPESARLNPFANMDGMPHFADVRMAWNANGIGVQVEVHGKSQPLVCDESRPRLSDGLSLWIDTRDARTSHRANRYCHQFHFLPRGGGSDQDEPVAVQSKIQRALQDAPLVGAEDIPFRGHTRKGGYRLELFLGLNALTGYDPENHPRLGVFFAVRDFELGEQTISVTSDFPYGEDPSLWSVLQLVKGSR